MQLLPMSSKKIVHYSSKHSVRILIFAVISLIIGAINTSGKQSEPSKITPQNVSEIAAPVASMSGSVSVVKVVDGDTISVLLNGKKETVRFIGIDTPEVVDPRKLVQCFGNEASEKTKQLLTGKSIVLQDDPSQGDRDKYSRLLRYVFLDGININKLLIKDGYAHEYTYRLPYVYQSEFKAAEVDAREHKRGLWADGVCPLVTATPSSL